MRFWAKSVRFCHAYKPRYMPFKKIHKVNPNIKWGVFGRKVSNFVIEQMLRFLCILSYVILILFTISMMRLDFVLIEEFLCVVWYCTKYFINIMLCTEKWPSACLALLRGENSKWFSFTPKSSKNLTLGHLTSLFG